MISESPYPLGIDEMNPEKGLPLLKIFGFQLLKRKKAVAAIRM